MGLLSMQFPLACTRFRSLTSKYSPLSHVSSNLNSLHSHQTVSPTPIVLGLFDEASETALHGGRVL
jgi:hypothetical protein